MIFYFDENFPRRACEVVERLGHEWIDHRGSEAEGLSDARLFASAQEAGAVLVSTDMDFFHTIQLFFPSHFGILVIALKQPSGAAIVRKFEWALRAFCERDFLSRTFLLRDEKWFARPPLHRGE